MNNTNGNKIKEKTKRIKTKGEGALISLNTLAIPTPYLLFSFFFVCPSHSNPRTVNPTHVRRSERGRDGNGGGRAPGGAGSSIWQQLNPVQGSSVSSCEKRKGNGVMVVAGHAWRRS